MDLERPPLIYQVFAKPIRPVHTGYDVACGPFDPAEPTKQDETTIHKV